MDDEEFLLREIRKKYDALNGCCYAPDDADFVQDNFNNLTMALAAFVLTLEEEVE
jgi:hypothetical protein